MLTLKRFAALAASYGGDLRRWPDDARGEAQALVKVSSQARDILADAHRLDSAIETAGLHEEHLLLPPGDHEAALTRLRAGVAARIAMAESAAQSGKHSGAAPRGLLAVMANFAALPQLGWAAGMATACGLAIVAGLWLGGFETAASTTDTVLTLLQPPPSIQILAD